MTITRHRAVWTLDDNDHDSIAGDAEDVNNLALGMCVQWPYVDVLRPFLQVAVRI